MEVTILHITKERNLGEGVFFLSLLLASLERGNFGKGFHHIIWVFVRSRALAVYIYIYPTYLRNIGGFSHFTAVPSGLNVLLEGFYTLFKPPSLHAP